MTRAEAREILGVGWNATGEEIQSAWRRAAKRWHPDRNPSDFAAAEQFRLAKAAFDVFNGVPARMPPETIRQEDFSYRRYPRDTPSDLHSEDPREQIVLDLAEQVRLDWNASMRASLRRMTADGPRSDESLYDWMQRRKREVRKPSRQVATGSEVRDDIDPFAPEFTQLAQRLKERAQKMRKS